MPKVDFRTNRKFNKPKQQSVVTRDFSKLQNTELDSDKLPFDVFHSVKNMVHKGLNADIRKGIKKLGEVTDILGIGFHKKSAETALLGMVQTTATSKLVKIDRSDGSTTDIKTAIAGTGKPVFTSLRQAAYVCNGIANIEVVDSAGATTTAIALPSSGIARFVTNDTERLIVAQTDGILRASAIVSGDVASANFTVSGTAIGRAVLMLTQIVDFKSLKSNGKIICVAGENEIELHRTPDFATNGITVYPADVSTVIRAYPNIGVSSNDAIIPYGTGFFVKPTDGVLYFISEELQDPQEFRDDLGEMESISWLLASSGIDLNKKMLYLTGSKVNAYDTTIAFNIQEQNFSHFENIWGKQWVSDSSNLYYLNSYNYDIQDAFSPLYLTDNGADINWGLQTASVYGDLKHYWKATDFFMNIATGSDTLVKATLVADGKIGGDKTPVWTQDFDIDDNSSAFTKGISGFGGGTFSGVEAGISMLHNQSDIYTEYYNYNTKVLKTFKRARLTLSGSANNTFSIRGVGLDIEPTSRVARGITMTS